MTNRLKSRIAGSLGLVLAAVLSVTTAHAQVAPVPYLNSPTQLGFAGNGETEYWGAAPDEDGFRKGFSFRSFSAPVSTLGTGFAFGGMGPGSANFTGLTTQGAQYGYSFKGIGDMPVTLFGGVNSLRTSPDVFTAITNPGFGNDRSLATSFNAGVEFKPTSNLSLSLSAGFVQPAPPVDADLRSQLIRGYR